MQFEQNNYFLKPRIAEEVNANLMTKPCQQVNNQ